MKRHIAIILLIALLLVPNILAVDCVHGLINDTYPGDCGAYIDQNNDKICDSSQTSQELNPVNQVSQTKPEKIKSPYNFLIIAVIAIIVYLLSSVLSRKGKIYSPITHKKIWNLLLLISFLGVGISGIFLVLRVEFGIDLSWFPKMLFWHVETGIVMALISIFHIIWHWRYFKSYIKK